MSVAEQVAYLEAENDRLRNTLNALLEAVKTAADALAEDESVWVEQPPHEERPRGQPPMEQVERRGTPDGAYRVDSQEILRSRLDD